MRVLTTLLLAGAWCVAAVAVAQPDPEGFYAGVWADDERNIDCVTGAEGGEFTQQVWAWVPDDLGLSYITLRFSFPDNLDLTARPVFNDQVVDVIYTDYAGGTVEWNMIFGECPSGWVHVFSQDCVLRDGEVSRIGIEGMHSMIRDCSFMLNGLLVLNELAVNEPGCATVPAAGAAWSSLKALYRQDR